MRRKNKIMCNKNQMFWLRDGLTEVFEFSPHFLSRENNRENRDIFSMA